MQRLLEERRTRQAAIDDKRIRSIEMAEYEAAWELLAIEAESESRLALLQMDLENRPFLRQVYHEAPEFVFELIVSMCSDVDEKGWGHGGLNAFRLD